MYKKSITFCKVLTIVGLSKNSGKTSFLNWLIKKQQNKKIAITTTGRDGEDIDLVTGEQKPKVQIPKNAIFTTFDNILNTQSSQLKGLKKLPFRVIGNSLWLCEALEDIETEIIGPVLRKEQEALISIFGEYNPNMILIDGSLDRKSICLSEKITDIILVLGASAGNINEIKKQVERIKFFTSMPTLQINDYDTITYDNIKTEFKSIYSKESFISDILAQKPNWIYFPGAITDTSWNKLKNSFKSKSTKIIFNHPINVNINKDELKRFLQENTIYSRLNFPIRQIAVNSYSPYNEHIDIDLLKKEIKDIFTDKEVIDITQLVNSL